MTAARIFTLLWLLTPRVAGADTLDVYGNLTAKTVLMPSGLPRLPDVVVASLPSDKTDAIARIEKALSEQGLEVVQDGPHFVRVFRKAARDSLTNAPLRGAELAGAKGQEALSPGMINFMQADLNQVLSIYAAINQRTILRPMTLPAPTVSLKSQCALSKGEALVCVGNRPRAEWYLRGGRWRKVRAGGADGATGTSRDARPQARARGEAV